MNRMADPKVTVMINTYNDKRCVGKAIRSVLAQTLQAHEILVIDDGSTDGTRELIEREFGNQVTYHYHANRGIGGSRNVGIAMSTGDWIAFLDSDDHWMPEKLELQVAELRAHPNAAMVSCWALESTFDDTVVGKMGLPQPFTREVIRSELRRRGIFTPSGAMVRRDVLLKVEGFPEDIMFCEDWVTFCRIAASYEIAAVHKSLFYKTQLMESLSSKPKAPLKDGLIALQRCKEALASHTWPQSWMDFVAFRQSETQLHLHTAWLYAKARDKKKSLAILLKGLVHCPFLAVWQYRSIYWLCARLLERNDAKPATSM